jgi:hypothetical protein
MYVNEREHYFKIMGVNASLIYFSRGDDLAAERGG